MFEVLAGSKPGALRPATTKAVIDGAVKIIGAELRAMPACIDRMSPLQRARLELYLCDAIRVLHAAHEPVSLEPARGSGMPGNLRNVASRS